ncbi:MAG: TetR/AcrR family transcriptional regulator [Pseudomonadota bacterium]
MNAPPKPHGRREVMEAVLDAAEDLFSTHGPQAVSFRDIAARANVNHGLIHRHFGSKENLRKIVQDRLSQKIRDEIGDPDEARDGFSRGFSALGQQKAYWKLMARTFLDDEFEGDIQSDFPYVRKMTALVEKAQGEGRLKVDLDPRVIVAGAFALGLGLMVFEQYILPGVGLKDVAPAEARQKIAASWLDLLSPPDPED